MVDIKNYLSYDGLKLYDQLIKEYIATADEAVLNQILGEIKDGDATTIAALNNLIAEVTGTAGSALQQITKGTDGQFVTTTVSEKGDGTTQSVGVSVKTATLDGTEDGLVTASDARTELDGKVDKVEGKQLSTNDFTDDLKAKLEGIAADADDNVQADWNETDTTSDAYIKNKPTDLVRDSLTIAGVDLKNNITKEELLTALNVKDGADANVIEAISVNGVDATITGKKATVTIPDATTLASGVMSAADKTKLDGLANIKSVGEHLDVDANGKLTVDIPDAEVTGVDDTTVNGMKLQLTDKKVTLVDDGLTDHLESLVVTVEKAAGTSDDQYVYEIKRGGVVIGTINHPKEMVVESGEIVLGSTIPEDQRPADYNSDHKYLKLVIANQDTPVYIDTQDLVDAYTPGAGIAISNTNEVSIALNPTQGNVTLSTDGGLKANLEGWETVQSASHTHDNNEVLDGISAEDVAAWNAKQDAMVAITTDEINALFAEETTEE